MKIKIKANSGIFGKDGAEVPAGTVMTVDAVPRGWESRCEIIEDGEEKIAVATSKPVRNPGEKTAGKAASGPAN